MGAGLYEESLLCIEVESFESWQFTVAVSEEEGELMLILTLILQEVAVGLWESKGTEHDIIGQEMSIWYARDIVDTQRITPDGILTHIRTARGLDETRGERQHLAVLTVTVVAVHIIKRIAAVGAWCHTADDEASATVGACHTQKGLGGKGTVGKMTIEPHEDTLHRFEVLCIKNCPRHFKRIYLSASRETVGIVAHGVTLIVIGDGVREIDGIGCALFQRILERHDNAFS